MSHQSHHELEGRLNAHRKVLATLLAWAMRQPGNDLARQIEAGTCVQDHGEDPGAIPDPAFVIEAAAAHETQLLLERAKVLGTGT